MGFNTAFLMIEGATAADADQLLRTHFEAADLFAASRKEIEFEAASASSLPPNVALGMVGGWAVLWADTALVWGEFPQAASSGRCVLACLLSSVGSCYGFSWFADGALRRAAIFQEGAHIENVGEPLAEEAGLSVPDWGPDEEYVFELTARLTGVSQSDLMAALYQTVEFSG